jgi:siroheme synthase
MPVAIVEGASLPGSRVDYTTLEGLAAFADHRFRGPTLLLVGPQFHARARAAASDSRVAPAAEVNARA